MIHKMSRGEYTPHQKLLVFLHNVGAVVGKPGKTLDDLVKITEMNREELEELIESQLASGYLECAEKSGTKYYNLTGRGIIRVSSLYT
jgi:hypothetical protein